LWSKRGDGRAKPWYGRHRDSDRPFTSLLVRHFDPFSDGLLISFPHPQQYTNYRTICVTIAQAQELRWMLSISGVVNWATVGSLVSVAKPSEGETYSQGLTQGSHVQYGGATVA